MLNLIVKIADFRKQVLMRSPENFYNKIKIKGKGISLIQFTSGKQQKTRSNKGVKRLGLEAGTFQFPDMEIFLRCIKQVCNREFMSST